MLKKIVRQNLSQEKVDQLRRAKTHFNGMVDALFRPSVNTDGEVTGRSLYQGEAGNFIRLAKSCSTTPAGHEREALKRKLMERVVFDARYKDVLETLYMKTIMGDEDVYTCVLAAAHYAAGEIKEASALFEQAIESNPTAFNYLSLSRCASHGLSDDRRAVEILESALKRHPGELSLVLSIATAHFRLGETARANDYLRQIEKELETVVRAKAPNVEPLSAEIATALEQKLSVRPKGEANDAYSEESVEAYWNLLWYHMNTLNRYQHGWPGLNHLYQEQIGEILTDLAPAIRTVINFGVFCAEPDYQLANRFPEIKFFGVDRELHTKELNDKAYQAPNIEFLAANIMEILPEIVPKSAPSLMFHARTGTLCYPEFLRTIYSKCAAVGVEYIALWENISLSRATLRFHDFDDMPAESIPYLSVMFIHNYKKILEDAGYKIISYKRKPSNVDLLEATELLGDGHIFIVAQRKASSGGQAH